jgi:hypothetical protein
VATYWTDGSWWGKPLDLCLISIAVFQ